MFKHRLPQWLTMRIFFLQLALFALPIILLLSPESVYAQAACAGTRDYGDAPASYGVACATPSGTLRIGAVTPDTEASPGFQGAGATGDSTNGTNDENFLNPLTPIDLANTQYIWTVPVVNTTGGTATLAGWIDFNGNGVFDTGERVTATVANGATSATLTWNIPTSAAPLATTYVRLRLSTDANVGPTGDYPTNGIGEVEDYAVQTLENQVCTPGTSFYFINDNGSNGEIRTFDVSNGNNTLVTNPATVGNINGLAVDRWRGLIYYQDAANNTTPDGIFVYDVVNDTHATVTGDAATAPFNLPLGDGWQTASGGYANGRYYVGIDGDDTGRIYELTLDAAGTAPVSSRLVISPETLPGCVGNPPPGGTNCRGYGDILIDGNRMYVALWSNNTDPDSQIFDVYDINSGLRLNRQIIAADGFAFQLGRDGNGQIYAVTSDDGRVFLVTNNLIAGYPTPVATIGTVINDAAECPIVVLDFGDAPNSYGTNGGYRAARHLLVGNLRLGSVATQPDIRDLHGFANVNANGDDQNDYNGGPGAADDEEALPANPPLIDGTQTSYTLSNITVFNNTGTPATLYGWIDFNRDGQFQQTERTTVAVPSNPNPQVVSLTWNGLSGLVNGVSYVRLRLSTATTTTSTQGGASDGAFLATGYAANGEIEDYPITISGATAVRLTSFGVNMPTDWQVPVATAGLLATVVSGIAGLTLRRNRSKKA